MEIIYNVSSHSGICKNFLNAQKEEFSGCVTINSKSVNYFKVMSTANFVETITYKVIPIPFNCLICQEIDHALKVNFQNDEFTPL